MAKCLRNKPNNGGTVLYKRHQYKPLPTQHAYLCKACGKKKSAI